MRLFHEVNPPRYWLEVQSPDIDFTPNLILAPVVACAHPFSERTHLRILIQIENQPFWVLPELIRPVGRPKLVEAGILTKSEAAEVRSVIRLLFDL